MKRPAIASSKESKRSKEREDIDSDATDAVVKVFAAVSEPNYGVPWVYKAQDARTGTAFAVWWVKGSNRWLLTNAHVVRHAAVIQVRKRGDHQKFIAKVLCVGLDCDLAILTVEDKKFWEALPRVHLSEELPNLQDEVTVVGYPIGGDNACVTVGVVSRIDMQRYNVCWSRSLLAIQIDAAINPGNSGGPCFHSTFSSESSESSTMQCMGVAFQVLGREDAENIGYIIPSEVVKHFLVDFVTNGKYTGFASCGFAWQSLENAQMRVALGLKTGQSGIRVRKVEPASPASKAFEAGDIILEVQGAEIGDDGKVPFRGTRNERIDFHYLISKLFVGDSCDFTVLRRKRRKKLKLQLSAVRPLVRHDAPDPPQYFIVGGLVFVPLTESLLMDDFGSNFHKEAPISMILQWTDGMRDSDDHEIIVLSQVLASPSTVGFTDFYNVILHKFNGESVKNLEHLILMVRASKEEYFEFEIERNNIIILPRKEVLKQTPAILKENMISKDRSVHYQHLT